MKNKNCIKNFVKFESLDAVSRSVKDKLKKALSNGESTNDLILLVLPLGYYMIADKVNSNNLSEDIEAELISKTHLAICEYFYQNPNLDSNNMRDIMHNLKNRISDNLTVPTNGSEDIFDNLDKNELSIPLGYQRSKLIPFGTITKKEIIKELIGEVINILKPNLSPGNSRIGSSNQLYIFRSRIFEIKTFEQISKELGITEETARINFNCAMSKLLKGLSKDKINELRSLI